LALQIVSSSIAMVFPALNWKISRSLTLTAADASLTVFSDANYLITVGFDENGNASGVSMES